MGLRPDIPWWFGGNFPSDDGDGPAARPPAGASGLQQPVEGGPRGAVRRPAVRHPPPRTPASDPVADPTAPEMRTPPSPGSIPLPLYCPVARWSPRVVGNRAFRGVGDSCKLSPVIPFNEGDEWADSGRHHPNIMSMMASACRSHWLRAAVLRCSAVQYRIERGRAFCTLPHKFPVYFQSSISLIRPICMVPVLITLGH